MALPDSDDVSSLDFSFFGGPFVAVEAKSGVASSGLDISFFGAPFVGATIGSSAAEYNESYTETVSLTDDYVSDYVIALSESLVLDEILDTNVVVSSDIEETQNLDQDWSITLGYTEGMSLGDSLIPIRASVVPLTFSLSLTDAYTTTQRFTVAYAESLALTDSYTNVRWAYATVVEGVALTEALSATGGVEVDVTGDGVARFVVPTPFWEFSVSRPTVRYPVPNPTVEFRHPRPDSEFKLPE